MVEVKGAKAVELEWPSKGPNGTIPAAIGELDGLTLLNFRTTRLAATYLR